MADKTAASEALSKLIEAVAKDAVKLAIVRSDLKPDEDADLTDEGVIADAIAALMGYDICEEGPMQSVKDLVARFDSFARVEVLRGVYTEACRWYCELNEDEDALLAWAKKRVAERQAQLKEAEEGRP